MFASGHVRTGVHCWAHRHLPTPAHPSPPSPRGRCYAHLLRVRTFQMTYTKSFSQSPFLSLVSLNSNFPFTRVLTSVSWDPGGHLRTGSTTTSVGEGENGELPICLFRGGNKTLPAPSPGLSGTRADTTGSGVVAGHAAFHRKGHLFHHLRNKSWQVSCGALYKSYGVILCTLATLA